MVEIKPIDACIETPDNRDYKFENLVEEYAEGEVIHKKRPDTTTVFNQKKTPMCTWYSLTHIYNWENINESLNTGNPFTELDPATFKDTGDRSVNNRLIDFKNACMIEWYTTIPKNDPNKEKLIKQAIDLGMFVSTGSNNCDWTKTKQTKTYTVRADGKIVWHAWCIVDYDDTKQAFKCKNSRWPLWGDKWYFWLPYSKVYSIYGCYPVIDKDDTGKFKKFKLKEKVRLLVQQARDIYNNENCDTETKNFLEKIQLGHWFTTYYGL